MRLNYAGAVALVLCGLRALAADSTAEDCFSDVTLYEAKTSVLAAAPA